ncbi:hypothetical protein GCM10011507_24430 [Edaphobacter acidisoli]|uniref:Outer membrane protein beta-barrel domain-containing protein n=1 Tax=Edaphobacter acidisoli TaxID=2040573 RepID=A0A916W7A0_9BACT|nr:hypothetical protein [Edaphobacter acidisoli]GGA71945.1 hypothetical protein GCM10011507_24430 [Edaphobacter acidisoli]
MNFRNAVLFLAAAAIATLAAPAAHAQAAVYGTFTVNQLSNIVGSPVLPSGSCSTTQPIFNPSCISYNNSVVTLGGTLGAYYDFKSFGPVRLGADVRGTLSSAKRGAETFSNGSGSRLYDGLGGVRASFKTRWAPIRPYIQGSAGFAKSDYGVTDPIIHNNFQYMGYAGVDIKVLPVMDFRLVEFGYGGLNPLGTNGHNYPVKTVSSGIVFHLPF